MRDVPLLRDTIAAATKAHVSVALIERAEEHLALVEEEERVRREAEAKAKAEAEAAAKRREAAAAELRRMMDEANDEEGLRAAIAAAEAEKVDGHSMWMAQQVLTKLEEARIRREEELKAAEMTLEAALDLGDADAISDAISCAREAGVDDGLLRSASEELERLMAEEKAIREEEARSGLERAIDGDDDDAIRRAIERLDEVGLSESEAGLVERAQTRAREIEEEREAADEERRAAAGDLQTLVGSKRRRKRSLARRAS